VKVITFKVPEQRAHELGLITCTCGHRENNHFTHSKRPCSACVCTEYTATGVHGVQVIGEEDDDREYDRCPSSER
jgi:hypothetical protein